MGELFEMVSGFENRSLDIVAASGGHTVKHLGDEVMFVANDAAAAATIAMDLVDAFSNEGDVDAPWRRYVRPGSEPPR